MVKLDKTDLNVNAVKESDYETTISVCFSELPISIVIDSTVETSLANEYMLNANGLLEVVKKYKNGGKASVFIHAYHPTNPCCGDLLLKKNSDLRKIIKETGIDCENQKVNSIMRKAIWERYSENLELQEVEIDASKEDAKKIWERLCTYLPVYSLFQSDRKNSDGDDEVQDPLKEAVKQIISDTKLQETLTSVAKIVENKLQEVSSRTLEKLKEMDPGVANSLHPVIPSTAKLKWAEVFKSVSIAGDNDIPINKRGSGVKRLILLNFFRAEAERRSKEENNAGIIYAIEEPETSQHPNNQRLLINAFKELSKSGNTQVILTTHSPNIVKELDFKDLRLIYDMDGEKCVISIEPTVLRYPSLNEVNYLAYGEANEEYHNELYGYLELQQWLDEYRSGKPQQVYFKHNAKKGKPDTWHLVLTDYIRHQIHHPENTLNVHFEAEELKQSIEDMRSFILEKIKKENEGQKICI